ncbi:hypothetical protein ACFLQS_04650, partial [Actinomycetota bacterium]
LIYLKLYDDLDPELINSFNPLVLRIQKDLEKKGLDVSISPACRLKSESLKAVKDFEDQDIDVIVIVHLSYATSLEATEALINTEIPIIVFNTSLKYDFSNDYNWDDVMLNHAIPGVQDMCSVLLRNNKRFLILSGHLNDSEVLDKLNGKIRSATLKKYLNNTRVGSIGGWFEGMGDFFIENKTLNKDLGVKVVDADFDDIKKNIPSPDELSVKNEIQINESEFIIDDIPKDRYLDTIRMSLAVRKWLEQEKINAFTLNFLDFAKDNDFLTVPFLETSKAMARGVGYAGEGDILTASLIHALMGVYSQTSFIEMFCPDWKNDLIFIHHMAEMNINLCKAKPALVEKDLSILGIGKIIFATGQFKEGEATIVDIAPMNNSYSLILSKVEVITLNKILKEAIAGWIRPDKPIDDFLTDYSEAGGTHHAAIVYGDVVEDLKDFGKILGFNVIEI